MTQHTAFKSGKVAVITGAADGIGRAAARRYASLGMHILLADRDVERLARTIAAAQGGRVVSQVLDVANFEQVVALKERAYADFSRVDVLMNNAGTSQWPVRRAHASRRHARRPSLSVEKGGYVSYPPSKVRSWLRTIVVRSRRADSRFHGVWIGA